LSCRRSRKRNCPSRKTIQPRLRDGLRFHDNEPVLARDCVASINRWMKRDAVGRTLALQVDALEAPDDRTIAFRLRKPFPQLPFAKIQTRTPDHVPAFRRHKA